MQPLNPRLFHALCAKYRNVGIVNDGQPAHVYYRPSYMAGKARMSVEVTGGEYYKLNCPFCSDTRQRFTLNHLWGTRDGRTNQSLLHLGICFNDDCFDDWDRRKQFYDSLFAYSRRHRRRGLAPTKPSVPASAPSPPPNRTVTLPRDCDRIDELPAAHEAICYLLSRGFDTNEMWRKWRVRYCAGAPNASPRIYRRLIIPIYDRVDPSDAPEQRAARWRLASWQARIIYDGANSRVRKYLFAAGTPKARLVYGLPRAVNGSGPVVITEGVTDVWRLGRDAVATFGKSMSEMQKNMILGLFRERPLVVAYDQDAGEERTKVLARLRDAREIVQDAAPVVPLRLPRGRKDVGECTRNQAWTAVRQSLSL